MTVIQPGGVGVNGVTGMGLPSTGGLTPEGLMIYLQTRMQGLDTQVNTIFAKQQKNQKIQELLNDIKAQLSQLNDDTTNHKLQGKSDFSGPNKTGKYTRAGYEAKIDADLDAIAKLDPNLGAKMKADLGQKGQILYCQDGLYLTSEVKASSDYIDNITKDINSSSQMDMINLQSIMSTRQTAVQLSTNLIQSLSHSADSIAANTGK